MTISTEKLPPGIYFDGDRGWHISALVVELARESGWEPDYSDAPEYAEALSRLAQGGPSALEQYVAETDPEVLDLLYMGAEAYLNEHRIPEGCWCGYSEGFGDWGVWEMEDEDDE